MEEQKMFIERMRNWENLPKTYKAQEWGERMEIVGKLYDYIIYGDHSEQEIRADVERHGKKYPDAVGLEWFDMKINLAKTPRECSVTDADIKHLYREVERHLMNRYYRVDEYMNWLRRQYCKYKRHGGRLNLPIREMDKRVTRFIQEGRK